MCSTSQQMNKMVSCFRLLALYVLSSLSAVGAEVVLGEENEDFDFDGVPGIAREFKFQLDGGRDFCLYMKLEPRMIIFLYYQVIRGGNKLIDFFLNSPSTIVLHSVIGNDTGYCHETAKESGVHSVCFDNTSYRLYSKLVHLYIHVHKPESWDKYINEINEVINTTEIFTESLKQVQNSITEAKKHAALTRVAYFRDFHYIYSSGESVTKYSIAMCIIIVMTSVLQIIFVRRLFHVAALTPTHKPRA